MVIEVRYLRGGVWTKGRNLTWPPPPALLFAALVNAWGTGGENREEEEALLWLENTQAPDIYAPPLGEPTLLRTFVPTNEFVVDDVRKELVRKRPPLELTSAFIQGEPIVAYHLKEEPPPHLIPPLRALVSRVSRLGNTFNLVEVSLTEKADEANWVPAPFAGKPELILNVWKPGFLEELKHRHNRMHVIPESSTKTFSGGGWFPMMAKQQAYRSKAVEETTPPISFQAVLSLKPSIPLSYWYPLAQKLHEEFGEEVYGKKVFFVPLAFVGYPYASGRILGVGVLSEGPRGNPLIVARARALTRREGFPLSSWRVHLSSEEIYDRASLRSDRWTRPSRRWASVTPVVWFQNGQNLEDFLVRPLEEQGLPQPTEIQASPFPYVKGVPEVFAFQPYIPFSSGKHRVFHIHLEFPHPVSGPILLGKGREMGMGFLVPLDNIEEEA